MNFLKFVMITFGVLYCCLIIRAAEADVIAFTDKTSYSVGEIIQITLKNDTKKKIYSHIHSQTPVSSIDHIEKEQNGDTEILYAQCQYPHCMSDTDIPLEISPDEAKSMIWVPVIYQNGSTEKEKLFSGTYRISIRYENELQTEWKKIYTNPFTIY